MAIDPKGRGHVLRPEDARAVYRMAQTADAKDAEKQIREASRWRAWLMPVMWSILAINAYLGARALFYFADMGGAASVFGEGGAGERILGAADRAAMVLSAAAIIFAAQVLAVRLALLRGLVAVAGWFLLALCAAFSIITSTMCIAIMMQGGIDQSVRGSDAYQLARTQAEGAQTRAASAAAAVGPAQARMAQVEAAYAGWQAEIERQFGRGSAAFNSRMRADHPEHVAHAQAIERARGDLEAARSSSSAAESAAPAALARFEAVKAEGGGAASHSVVATMAGWVGTTPERFAIGFSLFLNVLMELVRLFLAVITGAATFAAIRSVQAEEEEERPRPVEAVPAADVDAARSAFPGLLRRHSPARAAMRRDAMRSARTRLAALKEKAAPPRSSAPPPPAPRAAKPEIRPRQSRALKPKAASVRRASDYGRALERARAAALKGRMRTGGQDAIREVTGVSSPIAARIQSDLASEGVLARQGGRWIVAPEAGEKEPDHA